MRVEALDKKRPTQLAPQVKRGKKKKKISSKNLGIYLGILKRNFT